MGDMSQADRHIYDEACRMQQVGSFANKDDEEEGERRRRGGWRKKRKS